MKTTSSISSRLQKLFQSSAKAITYLIRKIWWRRKLIFVEARMKKPSEKDQSTFENFHIRLINSLPTEDITKHFPKHVKDFHKNIEQGHLGWGVFHEAKPVGFVWFATKDYYEPTLRLSIPLTPEEVYVFGGRLRKGHREGAAPYYVMRTIWGDLMDLGFTTCISLVNEQNRKAMLHHYLARYKERFLQVVAPLFFGRPLRAKTRHYSDSKLTRRALMGSKK